MCGRLSEDRAGQLALLDASVFFAASLVISGIIVVIPNAESPDSVDNNCLGSHVSTLLRIFLHSSIFSRVSLDLGEPVIIVEDTLVVECLATELRLLCEGVGIATFEQLNRLLGDILHRLCADTFSPHLLAVECGSNLTEPVLSIPSAPDEAQNRYASSAVIPTSDSVSHLVILVLCEPPSAEGVGV